MYAGISFVKILADTCCVDYVTREQDEATALAGLRDQTAHSIRRKPWTRATSVAALKGYEEILKSTIHELLGAFTQRQGEDIDISTWMTLAS